jgi:glutathione S-transferase
MITISAFEAVPEFARGLVRDLRARWALEEAGLSYRTRLLKFGDQDNPDYRALQPFGQVPIFEEDGLVVFESGAIVLHIGARSEALLPKDGDARARATQWLVAALNSIEPFVMNVTLIDIFYANEEWAKLRRPGAVEFLRRRLSALSKSLGDKLYLDGDRFTAGDLTSRVRSMPRLAITRRLHNPSELRTCRGHRSAPLSVTPARLSSRWTSPALQASGLEDRLHSPSSARSPTGTREDRLR